MASPATTSHALVDALFTRLILDGDAHVEAFGTVVRVCRPSEELPRFCWDVTPHGAPHPMLFEAGVANDALSACRAASDAAVRLDSMLGGHDDTRPSLSARAANSDDERPL